MFNSTECEIYQCQQVLVFLLFLAGLIIVFGDLNLIISFILIILIFMSNLNFIISLVEHEKGFKLGARPVDI